MIQSDHGDSRDASNQSDLTSTTDKTIEDHQSSVAINEEQTADGPGSLNDSEEPESTVDLSCKPKTTKRRRRRHPSRESAEQRLQGRRGLCRQITDIAPGMLKTSKLRILGQYLDSTKGLDDGALTAQLKSDAKKITSKDRILQILDDIDPDVNRRTLKKIMLFSVLLQEETYSLEETRLEEKVIEYEKSIVKRSKTLDFFDPQKHDLSRWHQYDTYRIVLETAWRNRDDISTDEANLLRILREHLNIAMEEHWLIEAHIKRFPKAKGALHTRDDVHEARKQLQRESLLWSYRDENKRYIDVIPAEVVDVLRYEVIHLELQRTNYRRILHHDSIKIADLRKLLISRGMDRYGNKSELIDRIINSDIRPSSILSDLDRPKLSEMCRQVGLKSSDNKSDLISRLIDFYDDLTFEERTTRDEREEWYNNYEILAARQYSDLRAKKQITKDLEIEHQFEQATDFLFEVKLSVSIDKERKGTQADGRIELEDRQTILWDCKSAEKKINLQDYLEDQFDGYLRHEREQGFRPLVFIVIAPTFSRQSLKLAYQYKAQTNWDVALVTAEALKYLAESWSALEPNKPFPVQLLNRTEIIDKEKADFLMSLA